LGLPTAMGYPGELFSAVEIINFTNSPGFNKWSINTFQIYDTVAFTIHTSNMNFDAKKNNCLIVVLGV
jgi:hypothetical protein